MPYYFKKRDTKKIPLGGSCLGLVCMDHLNITKLNEIFFKRRAELFEWLETKDCNICQTKYNIISK